MTAPAWLNVLRDAGYPTDVVVLDFETYYSVDYSLAKLSTVEFVQDPRFEVLCLSAHIQGQPYDECRPHCWVGEEEVESYLRWLQTEYGTDLERCTVVAQNAYFEAAILAWRYDIRPTHFIDVAGLHRHIDARGSHRLKDMAEAEGLTPKGDTSRFKCYTFRTRKAKPKGRGKTRKIPKLEPKLHGQILDDLVEYANHDVRLEWELFTRYLPRLSCPAFELKIMQHTLDIWTTPRLAVDYAYGEDLARRMDGKIDELVEPTGLTREEISGNKTFEAALTEAMAAVGEKPPVKPKKGGGTTLCLAKDDPEREALLHHRDPAVRQLVEARAGIKSWPNHVKRVRAIMAQCRATGDRLCVPLRYHGAHTGRWSGGECVTGDHDVLTPDGWVPISDWSPATPIAQWNNGIVEFVPAGKNCHHYVGDLWTLNQRVVSGCFTPNHRFVRWSCKGVWGEGYAGETPRGFVPSCGIGECSVIYPPWQTRLIVAAQADGWWRTTSANTPYLQFRFTKARKLQRLRVILRRLGLTWTEQDYGSRGVNINLGTATPAWITPSMKVLPAGLSGGTACREAPHWDGSFNRRGRGWRYTTGVRANADMMQQYAAVSGYTSCLTEQSVRGVPHFYVSMTPRRRLWVDRTGWTSRPFAGEVYCPTVPSGMWLTRHCGRVHVTGNSINLQNLPARNPEPIINEIRGMLVAPPGFKLVVADASQIEARVLAWEADQEDLLQRFATGEEIYAGFASRVLGWKVRKPRPSDPPALAKKYAWARNAVGKVAILGGGYGMGGEKMQATAGGAIDIKTAYEMVKQYRTENDKIVQYWSDLEDAFACAVRYGKLQTVGHVRIFPEPVHPDVTVIELPSGRWLRYRARVKGVGYNREISVQNTKTKIWGHTYGGSLCENVVQAMSRDLLAGSILDTEEKGDPVVLTVHDELVGVVPEARAEPALARMIESLSTPPAWAEGCPLAAEGSVADRYAK